MGKGDAGDFPGMRGNIPGNRVHVKVMCNRCGNVEQLDDMAVLTGGALAAAEAKGWVHAAPFLDFCPGCKAAISEEYPDIPDPREDDLPFEGYDEHLQWLYCQAKKVLEDPCNKELLARYKQLDEMLRYIRSNVEVMYLTIEQVRRTMGARR